MRTWVFTPMDSWASECYGDDNRIMCLSQILKKRKYSQIICRY